MGRLGVPMDCGTVLEPWTALTPTSCWSVIIRSTPASLFLVTLIVTSGVTIGVVTQLHLTFVQRQPMRTMTAWPLIPMVITLMWWATGWWVLVCAKKNPAGGGGDTQASFIRGDSVLRSNPLSSYKPFLREEVTLSYTFHKKNGPLYIPTVGKLRLVPLGLKDLFRAVSNWVA